MAIKLTDIVTVMKEKWTYGDKFFGYTEEFNDNHNTQYPALLITPPTSVFPEVGLDNGWENYTFEIYFSDMYNRTQQANESIEKRWENLQDLATEWLDMFLNNYQNTAPILAFLEDESVTLERNKEVANDKLLQIKMTFSWRVLSKCFRPQSTYPNQITDLVIWLRADSLATFSIPTKAVSSWEDGSLKGNDVSQSTDSKRPLRYTYNNGSPYNATFNQKTRFDFPEAIGTAQKQYHFLSDGAAPITGNDFTIFNVTNCKPNLVTPIRSVYGYVDTTAKIEVGLGMGIAFAASVTDGSGNTITTSTAANPLVDMISTTRLTGDTLEVSSNNGVFDSSTTAGFDATGDFDNTNFTIGGVSGGGNGTWLEAAVAEVIVYNRALTDSEVSKVQDYLNKKYKIY